MGLSFSAQEIASVIRGEIIGNATIQVGDVSRIEQLKEGTLSFVTDAKYMHYLGAAPSCVVLLSRSLYTSDITTSATLILVDNARGAMAQLLTVVESQLTPHRSGVEQPVFVAVGVEVPDDAYIGAFTYIGKNVKIGCGVQIYPQVYIGDNVVIGDGCIIYAGVKIYHDCSVGRNCILHSGVVIGADGFGFEPDAEGINRKIPQLGHVLIEDDVEVGANTTIDRAMMGSTIVRYNTKIDNLVQVAHNVTVGESTFLCSQVGIAGSSSIGSHCVLAGQVGVAGHLQITDNCIFGAKTGVPSSIRKPGMYQGYPAIDAAIWRRAVVGFKNLPQMLRLMNRLEAAEKNK